MNPSYLKSSSLILITTWLVVFAFIPFALVLVASFLQHDLDYIFQFIPTLANYQQLFDVIYLKIFVRSLLLATIATALCLLIAYPFTYLITRLPKRYQGLLILLVIIPLWTSSLIRTYAMIAILKNKGLVNSGLLWLGIINEPLTLLYTNAAVIMGLVYNLLPFMILPLYANMERLDYRLVEAARDLGANAFMIFYRVIIPLSKPGIISGCILVFLPAMTLFYIPAILGGSKSMLLGNLIQQQFLVEQNWALGSSTSVLLIAILLVLLVLYWRTTGATKGQKLI